jgi:hypothetical protein
MIDLEEVGDETSRIGGVSGGKATKSLGALGRGSVAQRGGTTDGMLAQLGDALA